MQWRRARSVDAEAPGGQHPAAGDGAGLRTAVRAVAAGRAAAAVPAAVQGPAQVSSRTKFAGMEGCSRCFDKLQITTLYGGKVINFAKQGTNLDILYGFAGLFFPSEDNYSWIDY